ncbi:lantibiotic dehydratase [Actinoplanes sp. NPDC049118]|uniref:lantibiotic dehydratase n=1 Tax=Actinoplanes sp. NPDC049118 TaxID=3155769 RepID=UPI003400E9F2
MSDDPENVLLPGGRWRLWEHFALRGPGFPAHGVLRMAPDGLATEADKFGPDDQRSGPEWAGFLERFDEAAVETARLLQAVAAEPRFRAAVAWQNPTVLRTGIAPFLNWTPTAAGRTSMPRQREELVAHYWQRFCVKNDTIGFFGPVGWGRWDTSTRHPRVQTGTGPIAASTVYFASWAIDALARTLDADPAMRAWVPPRRVPYLHVADDHVRMPGRPARRIAPLDRAVLVLCDGTRRIDEIAAAVGVTPAEAAEIVTGLVGSRCVTWRLEVPASTWPERALRKILERITDPAVREPALAKLAVLEHGRDAVQAAGTDAAALTEALSTLETDFSALTAASAQRSKGSRTAPCRGMVYSDSRRSATATIGTAILDELAPLELCLTSASWLTGRFATVMEQKLRTVYDRLAAGGEKVDLGSLWLSSLPAPHPDATAEITALSAELKAKWARIIAAPEDASRVQLSSAEIAEQVRAEFDEQPAGWATARYFSPDLLLVTDSPEALDRGEFTLVLGEMHCAINTMAASLFVHQHPDRAELVAETDRDFPGPRLQSMLPKELPLRWSVRSRPSLERPYDYQVALVDQTCDPLRERSLLSADIEVADRGGRLVAVLPDGAEFGVLDVFGNALTQRVMDQFSLRPAGPHTPRVTIDRMIVARETWRVEATGLTFAADKTEAGRFVLARQWRQERGLPRFVFVVSPTEPRPFYVDFDSPVYVGILAKAARRLARTDPAGLLTISEMLPTPEQTWLTDDQGDRYTSELRFVAVDQHAVGEA